MKNKSDYPIQKCLQGEKVRNLSDIELLSIAIGSGSAGEPVYNVASRLYYEMSGLRGIYGATIDKLSEQKGLGKIKSIRILSALEMGRRIISNETALVELNRPEKVWRTVLNDITGIESEIFIVLVLNTKNCVVHKSIVSVGTVSQTLVHPREVFRTAIRESGSSIVVCHNHPSGDTEPSQNDLRVTERLVKAAEIIGIELLDHLIVTERGYNSLKESGHL